MIKKKISKLVLGLVLGTLFLSGCAGNSEPNGTGTESEKTFEIGISQLAEHPALDDARLGFEDGLEELGINAKIDFKNAQGDIPTSSTIAEKFSKDDVDLIYTIATPAVQAAKQTTDSIPILFSAVTDPIEAGLVSSEEGSDANITGTSDEAPIDRQLKLFKELDPSIEKIGIVFNTSEPNSEVQVKKAKEIAPEFGLEIVESGISNINDLPQTMDSLIKNVDALYTIADNMVASGINIISEKALENKMVTVGAEDAHVKGGILITDGLSYYELGKQTASMAKKILLDGESPSSISFEKAKNTTKVFNKKTMETLGIDIKNEAFKNADKFND